MTIPARTLHNDAAGWVNGRRHSDEAILEDMEEAERQMSLRGGAPNAHFSINQERWLDLPCLEGAPLR